MAQAPPSTQDIIKKARNILVGKVPMPMEQCHEITKALIYKFISVEDLSSQNDGDEPTYFLGPAVEYRWDQLLEMRHSATEVARRYQAGLAYIGGRTDIPAAFQSIYRDAFLPYNDAPTLRAFLEQVNEFKTDNTETIGDAFEHLLRDTGAQGKAGQFRTPRHIIDFIVGIVNPQSNETILDPDCGTGGFLAAAWQHIRRQEGAEFSVPVKNRLAANLVGYDLAPDMVKLAAIHLYLQHQQQPRIAVYDTISHDRHWNDHYDVILANPPFMSPAGIVAAHSRFYTQAKRTEVLFVDYIASHLTANGRAGVIVPEGIIFQSGKAYKQLRKLLVESYLAAVISLPGGVFQPYSGVKTSILILDKSRAAQSDSIAFFKVENDGFDLGAQRRPIDRNDLPAVAAELGEYLRRLRAGASRADFAPQTGRVVSKERLAADGDYNLSGERYRESVRPAGKWPLAALGEVCDIFNGSTPSRKEPEYWDNGAIPWFTVEDIRQNGRTVRGTLQHTTGKALEETSLKLLPKEAVLLCCTASVGEYAFAEIELTTNQQFNGLVVKESFRDRLLPKYLFHISGQFKDELLRLSGKTSFNFVSVGTLKNLELPLPPLSVQRELVAEVEGYEGVIAGARQVVANWRPRVAVKAEWPVVGLGEVCELYQPKTITQKELVEGGDYLVFGANGVIGRYDRYNHEAAEVLVGCRGTCGTVNMSEPRSWITGNAMVVTPKDHQVLKGFLYHLLRDSDLTSTISGSAQPQITRQSLAPFQIPLPPLSVQQEIVAELDAEQAAVDHAKGLAERMQSRIAAVVGRVWSG